MASLLTVNASGATADEAARDAPRPEVHGGAWPPHGSSGAVQSAPAGSALPGSRGSAPLTSALPAEAMRQRFDALLDGEELPEQRPPRQVGNTLAAALAAGNLDSGDGGSPRAKLRRAAETFAHTPSLFKKRKPMPQPLETHGSGLDLLALAQDADVDAQPSTAGIMVDGWKNDPTYGKYRALKSAMGVQAPSRPAAPVARERSRAPGGSPATRYPALTSPLAIPSRHGASPTTPADSAAAAAAAAAARQSVHKVSGRKGVAGARTYTSRYRGVHQTFPTRRWEAQFRRAGKPTSLGCFDREEEAARAYDKMMLWAEIHQADMRTLGLLRNGVTNFPASQYEADVPALRAMSQDDLVQELRRIGREQAGKDVHRRGSTESRPAKHGSAAKAAPASAGAAAAGLAAIAAAAASSPEADAATGNGNGSASSAEAGASPQRLSSRSPRA